MEFRDAIKYLRSELGLTQMELANALHITSATIIRWEKGQNLPARLAKSAILDFARSKGASAKCIDILNSAFISVAKSKLDFSGDGLYAVEHASLRQLIDDASFPIYVCDMETDELLYLNQKACAMAGGNESPVGKKCYDCLMHSDTPCDFCHKTELSEGEFTGYCAYRPFDKVTFHVQGKLIQWNGHKAQVRYVLNQEPVKERRFADIKISDGASNGDLSDTSDAITQKLIMHSIRTENSTEQLKAIFENINGGVSVVVYGDNDNVRLAYANDRYYVLFGYTKQQFALELNEPHDTIYPDDVKYVSETITRVKETRESATFRYRIVKRDGSIAYIRCSSSVSSIKGLGEKVLISVLTDITESVRTEQQAAVACQRLDAVMGSINSAVTASLIDADGAVTFLFSNDLYHEMLGYTKEQYDSEVDDPILLVHPDDIETVRRTVMELNRVGETKQLQYRVICHDKKVKWLRVNLSVRNFPDTDRPVQLAIYSDITDMVEAQEQLALQHRQISDMLNETPSGIAVVETNSKDVAGTLRTTYYNDRFLSFSGYSREEYDAMLKGNEMSFVFDEDVPLLLADIEKLCNGELGVSVDTTVRCHTKDGGYRWLLLTGQLVQRRGETCVVNVALVDVTERHEAADRRRISEEMLRIASETDRRAIITYDVKKNECRVESRTLFSAKFGDVFKNVPQFLIDRGIVAPDSADELCSLFARIRKGEQKISIALQMHSETDKYEWFECNAATIFDINGMPDHAVLVFHNIQDQRVKEAVFKKWQHSIHTRPPQTYSLFRCNLSHDGGVDGREGSLLKIEMPSEATPFNTRVKLYVDEYVYPDDREKYTSLIDSDTLLAMFYRGEHIVTLDYREIDENGEPVWRRLTVEMVEDLNSKDTQAFFMFEDIDAEKKAEIEARALSETDPLTGALNRVAFAEKVNDCIRDNPSTQSALIMLDMDSFKQLNDTLGHAAGDKALQEVVAVLRSYIRSDDLVCRLEGDEFLVWLRDVPYDAVIGKTTQQICEHIRNAYSTEALLSTSAGIAIYPRDGGSYDELYSHADKALYKVKRSQKGTYAFFSTAEQKESSEIDEVLYATDKAKHSTHEVKRRMLIVADDGVNRTALKEIFKDEFLIETARNVDEAMIRLRHFGVSVSVVLLDLLMPDVDGFTVLTKMQNNAELRTIPVIFVSKDENHSAVLKAVELGAAEYITKPIDTELIRLRVRSVVSKAENERLRAQNSYLMLQRSEEVKYRTVLESTGTVVVEYDWRNHVFIYDSEISKYIAGVFDHRGLWQVLLSDMVANSSDVKMLQDSLISLANAKGKTQDCKLIKLKTPNGKKHWFRMFLYKRENAFGLAEKMIITFNDVHEEVLANDKLLFKATRDELTGLYNRAGFNEKAAELIAAKEAGYYVLTCFNIENFKVINDQYGTDVGDKVLQHVANCLSSFASMGDGLACRYMADKFAVLYPTQLQDSKTVQDCYEAMTHPACIGRSIRLRIGCYPAVDPGLSVSAMYDRASIAESSIKGRVDVFRAEYTETMRKKLLHEQQIVNDMVSALQNGEFEPWFQPQYNHATGALIGAEALVRWRKDGNLVPPGDFIGIFERNGFIYEVDQYIWRQVCICLRRWLNEGKSPLPVSVNVSRMDVLQDDFLEKLCGLMEEYNLPIDLLRLEITESAFSESTRTIIHTVGKLIERGFIVEIDDFGSGYSSLNTLKDVPTSILKLDMRFFENTANSQRGGNIIESVVRMAKWLGTTVIAEGVEDVKQADFLKSIGCYYIQGYLYAKPMPCADYEKLMTSSTKEHELTRLKTLRTLDNNQFWNPESMDSLIFNSYAGAACILDYSNNKVEMLRVNDAYLSMLGFAPESETGLLLFDWLAYMDNANIRRFSDAIIESAETKNSVKAQLEMTDIPGNPGKTSLMCYLRVIATVGNRYLVYCLNENITAQVNAENKSQEVSERMSMVLTNSLCGITAVALGDDGSEEPVFINDRFFELTGLTREKFRNEISHLYDCIIPEDRQGVISVVSKLRSVGDSATLQMRVDRIDGTMIWLRADIIVVKFKGIDQPVQLANFLDITEQIESEKRSQSSAKRLEVIMGNINGGVSALLIDDNATSRMIFNNEKYYELYGYTRAQAEAEELDTMSLIHPDDLPDVMAKIRKLKTDGVPTLIDYRIRKRDGSRALLRANTSLMKLEGYDDVITSVIMDISEIKSLEDKLSAIINNINGGVSATYIRHGKPHFDIVNDRFCEILGYESLEEFDKACGNDRYARIHPDDRERIIKQFETYDGGKKHYTMEYRIVRKDGAVRDMLNNITVMNMFGIDELIQLSVVTDVTEQREAERMERVIAEQMKTIMENVCGGITVTRLHGKDNVEIVFSNDGFYQLYGYTREQWESEVTNTTDPILPEDREKTMATLAHIVKTRGKGTYEYRCYKRDGSVMWTRVTNSCIGNGDTDDVMLLAIVTDTTELHKIQAENEITLDRLDTVMNSTSNGLTAVAFYDDRIEFVFANKRYYEIHGVSKEKYDRSDFDFSMNLTHPDDRDRMRATIREAFESETQTTAEYRIILPDGSLRWMRVIINTTYLAEIDAPVQVSAFTDITAEKEAAQTISQLINDTPGGFLRMEIHKDKNPTIIAFNDGFCHMVNMTRDEVMASYGNDAYKCLTAEDIASVSVDSADALAESSQFNSKCRLRKKDGNYVWVMVFGRFVKGDAGEMYLNSYFTDITEKMAEEERQKALLDNLTTGAALYEYNGKKLTVIHINRSYWKLVGREPVDYSNASVVDMVHPGDRRMLTDEITSAISQNRSIAVDIRVLCDAATYKPFHISANITLEENGKYLFYASYTPITEQTMSLQEMLPIALTTMMKTSTDLAYVKGSDLRYICCNRAIADMAGLRSPRDIIGKSAYDIFPKDIADRFTEDDRRILESGKPVIDMLESIPMRNGEFRQDRTNKYPLYAPSGEIIGLYCTSRDVTTERRKESQLELLTSTIPGGLAAYVLTNNSVRLSYFNDGYYAFSGYSRDEYLALTEKQPLALVFTEDRHVIKQMISHFRSEKQDGMTGYCEYRCYTKDGGCRYMSMKAVLTKLSDNQFVINVVQMDMSELKELEIKRMELLDNLPFGAALYSFDGEALSVVHINKQYWTLVNRENAASIGSNPAGSIHHDDVTEAFKAIKTAIAEKRNAISDLRIRYGNALCGESEYRYFHLNANLLPQNNGTYLLYVAYSPITDKEREFKVTSERLKLLTDNIPGGIATFRYQDGIVTPEYYNDGVWVLSGYTRQEYENGEIDTISLVFDEDRKIIHDKAKALISGAPSVSFNLRIHTKSGGYRWVNCKAVIAGVSENGLIANTVLTDITEQQEEKERLRLAEEEYRLAAEHSRRTICRYDITAQTITITTEAAKRLALPEVIPDVPYGRVKLGLISENTSAAYIAFYERIIKGDPESTVIFCKKLRNEWRWISAHASTTYDTANRPISAVISYVDVTEQQEKEAVYKKWQQSLPERDPATYTVFQVNLNHNGTFDSHSGELLGQFIVPELSKTFNEVTYYFAEIFVDERDKEQYIAFVDSDKMLAGFYRGKRTSSIDFRSVLPGKTERWIRLSVELVEYPNSTEVQAYLLYEDITEEKLRELKMIERAETDPLTGLLNRKTFTEKFVRAVFEQQKNTLGAMLFMDMDGFKLINDSFGHSVGDQALINAGNAISSVVREGDIVCRLGGDEFLVFIGNMPNKNAIAEKAKQLCALTHRAISLDIQMSISIGIALYPQDGTSFEALFHKADKALYHVKEHGKDNFAYYDVDMEKSTSEVVSDAITEAQVIPGGQKKRMLIVDDSEMNRMIHGNIFKDCFEIADAENGQEALIYLRHHAMEVDVVLLDILMPVMDGYTVLEKMQADAEMRTIPVVVISGDDDRKANLRAIKAGAYDFVSKPVDTDLLRIRVASAISKAENERLRLQNNYLALQGRELLNLHALLDSNKTVMIEYEIESGKFIYDKKMESYLLGHYDSRALWDVLAEDMVASEKNIVVLRALVVDAENLAVGKTLQASVNLAAADGNTRAFLAKAMKRQDDNNTAKAVLLTLTEEI